MDFNYGMPFGSKVRGMIESFLSPERGYQEAEEAARQAWEQAQGYQRPYWEAGNRQRGILEQAQGELLDPQKLLEKWMSGYQESPYAQQMQGKARESGLNAASSMGLLGSSAAMENLQQSAHDITEQDRQQYLQDLMQKYMQGIGIGQNIYGMGGQMAGALGQGATQFGRDVGGARFGEANAPGALLANILKTAANLGINYATGGVSGAAQGARGMGT